MVSGNLNNEGMRKRQEKFHVINGASNGFLQNANVIFGSNNTKNKDNGKPYIVNENEQKIHYFNAFIRLKDLLFFEKLPLTRGAFIKIT